MAVYTEVTDDALAEFLCDYDIGTLVAFRGIAEGVENSNYSLRTTAGDFILTLYEKRVDPNDLPWFLGLMEHLAQHGLVCPNRCTGAMARRCGTCAASTRRSPHSCPASGRGACARSTADRSALRWRSCTVAGIDYAPTRANALGPESWMPLLERCRARADEVQAGLASGVGPWRLASILAGWPASCRSGISMPTCSPTMSSS